MKNTYQLAKLRRILIVIGVILLANYPIAFAICHDITPHFTTLVITILTISILYGLFSLSGPYDFHAILIGLLAGNLVALLTWMVSFRDVVIHVVDINKLSVFYSLGVFTPIMIQFLLTLKRERKKVSYSRMGLTIGVILTLLAYLLLRLIRRVFHDTYYFNFFHFTLGLIVGLITILIIQFVLTQHILVFHKLSSYLKVMVKPIIAFFLGYILIMFTFTGIYALAYFSDPQLFTHLKNDPFGELMFYSFSTITGMTFSVVEPQHPIAFFLTTAEHFLGLIWMTVVFAAALAYLQAPFSLISAQNTSKNLD